MIKAAIEKILELAIPNTIDIAGRTYATVKLSGVNDPIPVAIGVHTLTGLVDYLKEGIDSEGIDSNENSDHYLAVFIYVEGHDEVKLLSNLFGPFEQRKCFMAVKLTDRRDYPFGHFLDLETFIISMQAHFVPTEDAAAILKLVGNIKDEFVKTNRDDGVTQTVTAKTGIATVGEAVVPNPVILAPFRTFNEIEQPRSSFVFRMRKGGNGGIECALFEADGGGWRLEAIHRIRDWLHEQLPEMTIIA